MPSAPTEGQDDEYVVSFVNVIANASLFANFLGFQTSAHSDKGPEVNDLTYKGKVYHLNERFSPIT